MAEKPCRFEERLAALERRPPCGEIGFEVRTVAVLVRVLELVERAVFGVEKLLGNGGRSGRRHQVA